MIRRGNAFGSPVFAAADGQGGSASPLPVGPGERLRFERDGFLTVRGMFDAPAMAALTRWTDELATAPEAPGRHWVYHEQSVLDPARKVMQRIENFCPHHEAFDRFVCGGEIIACVAALLGEPAVLFKEKINFKMPGGAGFKPHQDQQAGWGRYAPFFVTALVSIDSATLENGCLEIAGGRHKEGLIGEEWKPLDDAQMAGMDFTSVPTEPGDVIFFDSYVPHRSSENLTGRQRRVLYLTYNAASAGDHRAQYYADKHASFPPDIEREQGRNYVFRV